jgi:hypothetical protein
MLSLQNTSRGCEKQAQPKRTSRTRVGANHPSRHPPWDWPCANRESESMRTIIPKADPGLGARDPTKPSKQIQPLPTAHRRRSRAGATTAARHNTTRRIDRPIQTERTNAIPSLLISRHNSAPRELQLIDATQGSSSPENTSPSPRSREIADKTTVYVFETGTRLAASTWAAESSRLNLIRVKYAKPRNK